MPSSSGSQSMEVEVLSVSLEESDQRVAEAKAFQQAAMDKHASQTREYIEAKDRVHTQQTAELQAQIAALKAELEEKSEEQPRRRKSVATPRVSFQLAGPAGSTPAASRAPSEAPSDASWTEVPESLQQEAKERADAAAAAARAGVLRATLAEAETNKYGQA